MQTKERMYTIEIEMKVVEHKSVCFLYGKKMYA